MNPVRIGERLVGPGHGVFVVAEIGINHNGDLEIAKKLIDAAVAAGCDAVKFQKRTVEIVFTPEELSAARPSPFGATNGDLKRGLELGCDEYADIDRLLPSPEHPVVRVVLGRAVRRFHRANSIRRATRSRRRA